MDPNRILLGALTAVLHPVLLSAQNPPSDNAAATYLERYAEVTHLAPVASQVADVTHLVLQRDAGRLVLERGKLYLLSAVGGRTVGAVFRGEGRFALEAPTDVERAELRRFGGSTAIDDPIREAILIFNDSTLTQLRGLNFGASPIPGDLDDHVRSLINSLKGDHDGSIDSDLMESMLNGVTDGFFLAGIDRTRGDNVLFEITPGNREAVELYRPVSKVQWGTNWAVVTRFAPRWILTGSDGAWRVRDRLRSPRYRVDMGLSEGVSASLGTTATAVIELAAAEAVGPWLLFHLHARLTADSARWSTGERVPVFKASEDENLWVRAARRLQPGDSLSLTLFYHGTMIDRFGNFFFVDPGAYWYPVNGQGGARAIFDLTYHAPRRYPLVSIGERTDSSTANNVRTTQWVTRRPASFASFNLGLFEPWHVQHEGAPPLDVFLSDDAHNLLRRQYSSMGIDLPEQTHMKENVAADISNSLKLFELSFGETEYDHYSVTEIPYGEGVSFPGLIHLSWGTFQNTSTDGFDAFFRAHEASHQWWGNGVRPDSYRDAWLSEGLATWCGIWYVQVLKRRDDDYNRFLDQYRSDISDDEDAGPIWLGYRLASPRLPRAYDVLVYEKGAWIFHMLRTMMTDLSTLRSDRWSETLRDFYQTYKGRPASTDDFRELVERHYGAPLEWFFDQWVMGTAIPSYRVTWGAEPADNGRFRIHLHVTTERVSADFRMPVIVAVDLGNQRVARFRLTVSGAQTDYVSPPIPGEPRDVTFGAMHSVLAAIRTDH